MTRLRLITILAAILITPVAPAQDVDEEHLREAETRHISVTVQIAFPSDDAPFPKLPFSLYVQTDYVKYEEIGVALSDPAGVIQFDDIEVPDNHSRVFLGWHNFRGSTRFDPDTRRDYRERSDAMRREYYWPHLCRGCAWLSVDLMEGTSRYEMRIEALSRVILTGAVERAAGGPLSRATVWARFANSQNITDLNGRFPGLEVPAGVPNEVFTREFPVIASRLVSPEETKANTNLGLISIPLLDRSVAFDGILKHALDLRKRRWMSAQSTFASDGITIISHEANIVLTWMTGAVGPHGAERLTEEWEVPLYAPPGVYYVAPGVFAADEVQLGLLDLLRAGVDLTDSGISRIALKEGEYGGMHEFDALEMDRAIREAMKKHLKPDEETEPAPKP